MDDEQIPRSNYVELKVTTDTIVRAPWAFKRKRLVPWWCQSVVSGTPLIVYGIRDYDGHVTSIEHVRTDDIPDRVGRENLDAEKYLMFLNDILSWIKNIVCVEDTAAVYAFQWDPNASGRGVTCNALLRDAENAFLPEWYVNEMEEYFARVSEQKRRKGEKRKMEDETQRKGQEMKMKGMRRRFEASWPRAVASDAEPNAREMYVNYARSRSSGFHDVSDRERSTLEAHAAADEERYSRRESFQSGEYKREYLRSRREDDVGRPLLTEEQFSRDRTSTRGSGNNRKSPPSSHRSRRDKMDKSRRYERGRDEDQVQQQGRVRTGKTFNESRSQRFGDRSRGHPSSSDDRMSQESRVKRVKRDAVYHEEHRFGAQESTRRKYPHWN